MRGGIERWKRGQGGQGVRQALAYALQGECDAHMPLSAADGVLAAEHYATDRTHRFVVQSGQISVDALDAAQLRTWISGSDPETGAARGREFDSPSADLLLDATVNAPKTFSVAAMLDPDLAEAFAELQDRLRDRVITMWQTELNTRRGAQGVRREGLSRIEVVELRHERSRALDPHQHRHLWLNVKVQGEDGQWSRIDSRVAMRFQNVVNAEGDLAARTDPAWLAALAAKGFTVDPATGEITELAHLVRPLSRRNTQIQANMAAALTRWHDDHPGQEPGPRDLAALERWAWSHGRPGKPANLDEAEWAAAVKAEIAAIDHTATRDRAPVTAMVTDMATVDRDLLAALAVADADGRSPANGGRFSQWDVRAGAVRAVAAAGVAGDRKAVAVLVDDVVAKALAGHVTGLVAEATEPHVKALMATETVATKEELTARLTAMAVAGRPLTEHEVASVASQVLDENVSLNSEQQLAAAIIAGTDRLVAVTGPAGTGKTTMLRVAVAALAGQGRQTLLVAPTKKAASVAGRETRTAGSSVHALLLDYGWSATVAADGRTRWQQTLPGQIMPGHDRPYTGPRRFFLNPGDRIVVDEAGMLDADTARVLMIVAEQQHAGVAMIGDPRQVLPVGHGGAMELARRAATASVTLSEVHRFRREDGSPNTEYAQLTLRMREPDSHADALAIANELVGGIAGSRVTAAGRAEQARQIAVDRYLEVTANFNRRGKRRSMEIVTTTNEEAQAINEQIQQALIALGQLDQKHATSGQNGQRLFAGDLVQTRQNSSELGVANRDLWKVTAIANKQVQLTPLGGGEPRWVPAKYVSDHVHLAYASTVHGVQGETVDVALVMPGVDSAGLYVGMTRGRELNEVLTAAHTREAQIEELAQTMTRTAEEASVDDAVLAALRDHEAAAQPERKPIPAWTDEQARPYGYLTNLDADRQRATEAVAKVQDWKHSADVEYEKLLRRQIEIRQQLAGLTARAPGRSVDAKIVELRNKHDEAQKHLDWVSEQYTKGVEALTAYTNRLIELDAEVSYRAALPTERAHVEQTERERLSALSGTKTATPVDWDVDAVTGPSNSPSGPRL